MQRLRGKIALVTGAARGIGEAIARTFVDNGATCWLTDIDDARGIAVAAGLGKRARFLRLDVREEADWQRAMDDVLAEWHAVRNHTKSVALYCAEQALPIRCNSIHPAAILTPLWEPMNDT